MKKNERDEEMKALWVQVIVSLVMVAGIVYYLRAVSVFKDSKRGHEILARASVMTFSTFMIGFAWILIILNTMGMSRKNFVMSCLLHATAVSVVNAGSIWYFSKSENKR